MYTKGEVVWAKIKGFPWWPGIIAKVIEDKEDPSNEMECLVNFIGENSHAQLSLEKIAKFQQKYNEFAKMKKKKLLESIEIANQIIRGETTYEAESKRLQSTDDVLQPQKKKKDSKSMEKSPRNSNEPGPNRSESDRTSRDGSDLMSPLDKTGKRNKTTEKKELKRRPSFSKPANGSTLDKSPRMNKNEKEDMNNRRDLEEDRFMLDEPKPSKVIKMDENIGQEVPKPEPERMEELNGKLEKQASKPSRTPSSSNNILAHITNMNTNSTLINNINSINAVSPPPNIFTTVNTNTSSIIKTKKEQFEALHNLIIEKIVSNETPSVSGPIIKKSIEDVISNIDPETVSMSEILEDDLGKNMHTTLVLVDELAGLMPKPEMNIETELSVIKEKLLNYVNTIKDRLISNYVENSDYRSQWLKKLELKKEEKIREDKIIEEKKREEKKKEDRMIEEKKKEEKKKEILKEKSQEPLKSSKASKLEQINQKIEEMEENAPIKVEEDGPTLQINFEEYRYEEKGKKLLGEKNMKMVTTSTKINKPIYNTIHDSKKNDAKQKENVVNPSLRKKICLKMSKILQEKYRMEKDVAQELTLKVEAKIRHINPDMQAEYKDKVLIVLKLLKFSLVDIEEYANNYKADFSILRERLDIYQSQSTDTQGDGPFGGDSPSLAKEINRETNMMFNKMSELK